MPLRQQINDQKNSWRYKSQKETSFRFSCSNEDSYWPSSYKEQTKKRKGSTLGLIRERLNIKKPIKNEGSEMVLPKSMRLKGHRCFDLLYKEGVKYHESSMLLRVAKAKPKLNKSNFHRASSNACKCAIAISSKVSKKAVLRNRLRRLLHQHLRNRLYEVSANSNKWLLFSLKPPSSHADKDQLLKECDKLLLKAGLLQ